jgi:hypothetical protein
LRKTSILYATRKNDMRQPRYATPSRQAFPTTENPPGTPKKHEKKKLRLKALLRRPKASFALSLRCGY